MTTTPLPAGPRGAGSGPGAGQSGPAVDVRGLRKRYGPKQAVDGIDLRVERGEVFAVRGPHGAGQPPPGARRHPRSPRARTPPARTAP